VSPIADVVQVKPSARVKLQRNTGATLYDQIFAPAADTYTSHVGQAITLATNTSATLSQGNITAVRNAMLQMDNACTIKLNGQASGAPMVGTNSVWVAFNTSLTAIKVVNASLSNTVTVYYIVTN